MLIAFVQEKVEGYGIRNLKAIPNLSKNVLVNKLRWKLLPDWLQAGFTAQRDTRISQTDLHCAKCGFQTTNYNCPLLNFVYLE